MSLNASVWGVATLLGPAAGGSFAEFGQWRWAFLGIVPAAVLLAIGAWRVLPATSDARPQARFPYKQVLLVTIAVLDISVASLLTAAPGIAGALVPICGVAVNAAGLPLARDIADYEAAARTLFTVFAVIIAIGIPLAILVSRRDAARTALPQPAQ